MARKSFAEWWEEFGQSKSEELAEDGGQLWTTDMGEREELYDRRYQRPAPPALPAITNLIDYHRRNNAA